VVHELLDEEGPVPALERDLVEADDDEQRE
jgi:hypothetical protein